MLFYRFVLSFYHLLINIAALFNQKAKMWRDGRKDIMATIARAIDKNHKHIWLHCASLGEFEQARPLIEALKAQHKSYKIVLTFYSPSGYELRKNYDLADHVFYLPSDSPSHAAAFLDIIKPTIVFFIKYEFWLFYLKELKRRQIATYLVSAIFRADQIFFKAYGKLFLRALDTFSLIFAQNQYSVYLLNKHAVQNVLLAGDTRYDRVIKVAKEFADLSVLEKFVADRTCLVAGSTWPADEELLGEILPQFPGICLLIAPHEIQQTHISDLKKIFPGAILYSELLTNENASGHILIIDSIGLLNKVYRLATLAYLGGGFGKGIHNTLEAAVYQIPVLFGPKYTKFQEAKDMLDLGGGKSISNANDLLKALKFYLEDRQNCANAGIANKQLMEKNQGATDLILKKVEPLLV